jgi:hypothetical protein
MVRRSRTHPIRVACTIFTGVRRAARAGKRSCSRRVRTKARATGRAMADSSLSAPSPPGLSKTSGCSTFTPEVSPYRSRTARLRRATRGSRRAEHSSRTDRTGPAALKSTFRGSRAARRCPPRPDGGSEPFWRQDGKELYFRSPDNWLMSVAVELDARSAAGLQVDGPRRLFQLPHHCGLNRCVDVETTAPRQFSW